jgi:serine protein kinase
MTRKVDVVTLVGKLQDTRSFRELNWEGSFQDYIDLVSDDPAVTRTSYQRLYDMTVSYGVDEYIDSKKRVTHYRFFDDPDNQGADAVYGLDIPLMKMVNVFKSAAMRYGTERRLILLHGPVGSSKSTIARLLKKGLERYSRTQEGRLYTFSWVERDKEGKETLHPCPVHEEPLHLIPQDVRGDFLAKINEHLEPANQVFVEGDLCPYCRRNFEELEKKYDGDWTKVLSHVRVRRLLLSEKDRVGIGTFQPKDEKNQDSTELTGDINYRLIAEYGTESDPRAFNFDGEFNIANHMDEVIIGHTNEPEYRKLQKNEYMEALRDRTVKIDIPYISKLAEEIKIYLKDYNPSMIRGKHIAPHTIEMAAMWAVLTRLEDPKKAELTLLQKLKLYDGKMLPGYTEDSVRELRKETTREGMDGISPRFIQDKISNALVTEGTHSINPFMVLNELESGLKHHSLIDSEELRQRYRELLAVVKEEYENIVKNEVQRAISADEEAIGRLCGNYIDNVKAYTQKERVRNKYTGRDEEPDERLMRSIEEKIDIPESRKDDFRREIMNYIGALAIEGKTFDYKMNPRLHRALELKLFEDQKDTIKLTSLVSNTVDKATQEKIDIVKSRLIKNYGYDEESATDVLNFVASIFARGDAES